MPNGRPPVVWHLDSSRITDKYGSPPDRLTQIKIVMKLFEANYLNLDQTFLLFERICGNNAEEEDNLRKIKRKIKPLKII